MIWFASITINLGPTFLSGALAASAGSYGSYGPAPSCPLVRGPFRHYVLNALWIGVNAVCVGLTLFHLKKLHRDLTKVCSMLFIVIFKTDGMERFTAIAKLRFPNLPFIPILPIFINCNNCTINFSMKFDVGFCRVHVTYVTIHCFVRSKTSNSRYLNDTVGSTLLVHNRESQN